MPTRRESIESQWLEKFSRFPAIAPLRKHFDLCLNIRENLTVKRDAVRANNKLSQIGQREEIGKAVIFDAGVVAKAQRAVKTARDRIRSQQLALTPTVKDKGDIAAALLRQEVRTVLRSKSSPQEAYAFAVGASIESIVREAIFEAPQVLTNISRDDRDRLLQIILDRDQGTAVAHLNEQLEACAAVETSISDAKLVLIEVAEIAPNRFDHWLYEVAPPDDAEVAADLTAYQTGVVEREALGLPFKERHALIDKLLATNTEAARAGL